MKWLAAALLIVAGCSEKVEQPHAQPVALKPAPKPAPVVEKEPEVPPSLDDTTPKGGGDGKLYVYFLDVGEGDATLIVSPVGKTVLIDAGPLESVSHLNNRLSELVTEPIDLLVLTHPHADHFGGMTAVLQNVGV
ncbi:MAG: MBL fold metallo-hydrolase, partial [Myxococcaceae bacterium]